MPLAVSHLRRWLAVTAVLFTVAVAGVYFYARLRQRDVRKNLPGKMGIEIKRTASGFQFSKSDGKRTLFTIQASDVKEFKLNGRAELHSVTIILYGRDSSRFDQIYGDDFAYDPKSGEVTAKGEVQIDLEANPAGLLSPDQAAPKELKNPIHLRTRDLVFNRETGNASTEARVEFRTPQATGWAVGVQYSAPTNTLTLASQIHVLLTGANAAEMQAARGVITGAPRQIVLDHPHLERGGATLHADRATFFLTEDNHVERVLALGNVDAQARHASGHEAKPVLASPAAVRADQAELLLASDQNLHSATLTGNVHFDQAGAQPMQANAGRVVLAFSGHNELQRVRAEDGVRLTERAANAEKPKPDGSGPQDFELTAPAIDFFLAQGRLLDRAVTSGPAQIATFPANNSTMPGQAPPAQRTTVTAGKFEAKFARTPQGGSRLASVHGEPDAKIVNVSPDRPDRVSTSETVDAAFLAQGGIESITQQGKVTFTDNLESNKRTEAHADHARYTPADQTLVLTGNPRITGNDMATTAKIVRINRATGEAIAEGDVKSTYSQLTEQPNGALLASSSPIHVTAHNMSVQGNPTVTVYWGNARLWQDANVIQATSIQFDRDRRSVIAQGTPAQPVSTILVQPGKAATGKAGENASEKVRKSGQSIPIAITGSRLTYVDTDRKAHYEGGVVAKGADFMATAATVDVYLLARREASSSQPLTTTGQLDRMTAQGKVVIQQANRKAEGQTLVYTAADDKFVLTGGPPSIFDAERGKITGVSLTFFRHDARVLVEGEASTPVVTQTRVAR